MAHGVEPGSEGLHAQFVREDNNFEDQTTDARRASESDRDYYDGYQWTDEEIQVLGARGQPPVTYNRIQKKINIIKGAEIRSRVEFEGVPREPGDEMDSQAVTDAVRYEADRLNIKKIRSLVTDQILIEGYGGALVSVVQKAKPVADIEASSEKGEVTAKVSALMPEIICDFVPWDRIIYDPASRLQDFSDTKYKGIVLWMDLDDAIAKYAKNPHAAKDFEDTLRHSIAREANSETLDDRPRNWADSTRNRVKIVERYYRKGDSWFVAHYNDAGFIVPPRPTGLVDEEGNEICPLILTSAYVDRDNNRYGVVRALKWPQDEYNKRRSKLLHALNTKQVLAEEGAVPDVANAQQELARPDGYVKLNAGALRDGSFQVQDSSATAAGQFQLLAEAGAEIDNLGPTSEQIAGDSRLQTAEAIARRQQFATMELEPVMEALREFQHELHTHIWWAVRQFKKEEWWARVRDDKSRRGYKFVRINQRTTKLERLKELIDEHEVELKDAFGILKWPEGAAAAQQLGQLIQQQVQQSGQQPDDEQMKQLVMQQLARVPGADEVITANDVARLTLDIKVDVTPDSSALQSEQFSKLAGLAERGVPIPPEALIEASQLRNKREIMEKVETAQKPDPQVQQMQQQMQQLQMALLQIQVQLGQVEIQKTAADAQKSQAQAAKAAMEAQTHGAEAAAEIQKDTADAIKTTAEAGAITGGADSPGTPADNFNDPGIVDPFEGVR